MAGLANGTTFPELAMARHGGGKLSLPDELAGRWGVVLAYRGSWCSRCNAQLAAYQAAMPELEAAGIAVAAFSTDDAAHAAEMVDGHGLTFPVGYGVDPDEIAALLGSYTYPKHRSLESTNFLLRPDGAIEVVVYSSRAIGRITPEEVLGFTGRRRED